MEKRVYNFNAGPAILPEVVLKKAQEDLFIYPGTGMSVMEMSHRSKSFDKIINDTTANLRKLLNIPDNYHILYLQGGATLGFSLVPLNLMPPTFKADYIISGAWSKKAAKEAKRVGDVNIAASTENENFSRLPKQDELKLSSDAAYVHYTSNNTIYGTEYKTEPEVGNVPLVCDASSDILHKFIDVTKYAMIYAGAQKNIGPSGVTLYIIRDDMLERSSSDLHTYLNLATHASKNSLYNTPNTYGIYIMGLIFEHLLENGGLDAMYKHNLQKAELLYNYIDSSDGFYKGTVTEKEDRSLMNVTFRCLNEDLEKKLISEATENGFVGIKGHRDVGGLRASIYNAFPLEGVEKFVKFLQKFKENN